MRKLFNKTNEKRKLARYHSINFILTDEARDDAIDFLVFADAEDYQKLLKIIEIRRKANEDIAIVEAGSKKAYQENKKDEKVFKEIDEELGGQNE